MNLIIERLAIFLFGSYLLLGGRCVAQPPTEISKGRELVESYFLMKNELLQTFLMDAKIDVSSTPDSPELLETTGSMTFLQQAGEAFTKVEWSPTIIDDARSRNRGTIHVFNAKVRRIEGTFESKPFIILNDTLVDRKNPGSIPASQIYNATALHPYAFPTASIQAFKGGEHGFSILAMFKNFLCRKIVEKGGKFFTYWAPPDDRLQTYSLVVFDDGKIVRRDWFYSRKVQKAEAIGEVGQGFERVASVETRWKPFENVDVPVEAVMALNNGNFEQDYFLDCKMQYFQEDSTEFKAAVALREKKKLFVSEELLRLSGEK
ncbi:MAG: hypothetical protein MUC83_00575 [Pirellula sp.]|nr:hypothetical protein [Pirellula sp.]